VEIGNKNKINTLPVIRHFVISILKWYEPEKMATEYCRVNYP
jgi:hypothetical protein